MVDVKCKGHGGKFKGVWGKLLIFLLKKFFNEFLGFCKRIIKFLSKFILLISLAFKLNCLSSLSLPPIQNSTKTQPALPGETTINS